MWTDAFQMFIVFGGLMTLIIKATIEVGGITTVFEKASAAGKLEIDKYVDHSIYVSVIIFI